jgi:hypothetical protein
LLARGRVLFDRSDEIAFEHEPPGPGTVDGVNEKSP